MKTTKLILFALLLAGWTSGLQAQTAKTNSTPALEVFYFHMTKRCPTCISIEANTKKALNTYFKKELGEGKIKFTILNAEEEKNRTICEKYEIAGSSLVLVSYKNGKETKEDLTNFAFSYSRYQSDKFIAGLKENMQKMLK